MVNQFTVGKVAKYLCGEVHSNTYNVKLRKFTLTAATC
jgi:hypothetical protein